MSTKVFSLLVATGLLLGWAASSAAMDISGWTCTGNCGSSGADGVVTLSSTPGTVSYGWVSTNGSSATNPGLTPASIDATAGTSTTNGSKIQSPLFSANGGDTLSFHFNYVTSDGSTSYTDYAWARLLDSLGNEVAMLFAARTTPAGNTVPGYNMPPPVATLVPAAAPIIPGAPSWAPLGSDSGSCYTGGGCGYTGWVDVTYAIPTTGSYRLEFGVVNWGDSAYASGLAFDGILVGGNPPQPRATTEPIPANNVIGMAMMILLVAGLGAAGRFRRRC
ncbi:MAG: NF038132 family protein [Azonexus sp.]|jgi:hypothetical protein|uniref:NF038132 family protein n=1 Tax=Azonexus sp. TaxID=1872668 RepID=UPI00282F29B8|nr:NF038132 family protein [Azonexus sp.]MDR0776888.1 NF038132 family protein [Azonexus sp.]